MGKNTNLLGGLFMAKPVLLSQKETSLSAQIAEYLDGRGIYNDRLQCGKIKTGRGNWVMLCKTGTPDRFAIIEGKIIFIEVKTSVGRLSPEQIRQHEILRRSGAVVIAAFSFDEFLHEFGSVRGQIESGENFYR